MNGIAMNGSRSEKWRGHYKGGRIFSRICWTTKTSTAIGFLSTFILLLWSLPWSLRWRLDPFGVRNMRNERWKIPRWIDTGQRTHTKTLVYLGNGRLNLMLASQAFLRLVFEWIAAGTDCYIWHSRVFNDAFKPFSEDDAFVVWFESDEECVEIDSTFHVQSKTGTQGFKKWKANVQNLIQQFRSTALSGLSSALENRSSSRKRKALKKCLICSMHKNF